MDINVKLNSVSLGRAISKLKRYEQTMDEKCELICRRLAVFGAMEARMGFSSSIYKGERIVEVRVDQIENGYEIIADGETVLFIEFGAGITYGHGHPLEKKFHMGAGTYPYPHGKLIHNKWVWNWENPHGWFFYDSTGEKQHTMGNSPGMPMYNAAQDMRNYIEKVAREVFLSD